MLSDVVQGVRERWRAHIVGMARTSVYHRQYLDLDLDLADRSVLTQCSDINTISWTIKARAELIPLNYKPWMKDKIFTCSLCNLREDETVYHFVAVCPILANIRKTSLGKPVLDKNEYLDLLNGRDWRALVNFLRNAWMYRWQLVEEFNY